MHLKFVVVLTTFFLIIGCKSQNDSYDKKSRLLIKTSALEQIDNIRINTLFFEKSKRDIQEEFKNDVPRKLKIAIDPGHLGGEYAKMEEKYIYANCQNDTFLFCEGDLSIQTSLILETMLKNKGVDVFLTKRLMGYTSFGMDFHTWIKLKFNDTIDSIYGNDEITRSAHLNLKKNLDDLQFVFHRFFKNYDLKNRIRLINEFNPSLTIAIHYNVHNGNWRGYENKPIMPVHENYNILFVPGAFLPNELKSNKDKEAFTRLYYGVTIEKSIAYSKILINEFTKVLDVPPVPRKYEKFYPLSNCVYTGIPGVYARNLALTRLIESPICYGETLCQDNINEIINLSRNDTICYGIKTSKRVVDVANAYYQGIVKIFDL